MKEVRLYLVRHAESDWNANKMHLVGGRSNHSPLTEKGIQQAFTLGRYIAEHFPRPEVVFASPAVRTLDTATIALKSIGIVPSLIIDDRLQELSQGITEGQPRDLIFNEATQRRIQLEGLDFKNTGGQSMREVGQQMVQWANESYQTHLHDAGYAYIFGHGLSITSFAGAIEGWDHMQIYNARTPNTSITTIAGHPGNWRVSELGHNPQPAESAM